MKKVLILLSVILLMTAACGQETNDANDNSINENNETENTPNNLDNDSNTNEANNENQETDDNDTNENTTEEENLPVEPKYEINGVWSVVPIDESTNEDVVLLTIDDAPEHYALEMAETLHELDAPAIFFVNGHFLETDEEKEVLRKIHELGFAIGNHTYSHKDLSSLTEEEQKEEIIKVNDMVEEIIGERPVFFRPPFGIYSDYAKELLTSENMTYMNWSYGYDWEPDYMTTEAITDIMINTELLRAGSNLLMHDRKWTSEGLADIVSGLREKGYDFVDPTLIKTD